MKTPFVTKDQLEAIAAQYPTPFHIYDEQGIRENARRLRAAFAWNPGYREYFAVKATPTPAILKLLHEEGCGCDCSSLTELMMSDRCGITGENIMFSSNDTPSEEFRLADRLRRWAMCRRRSAAATIPAACSPWARPGRASR